MIVIASYFFSDLLVWFGQLDLFMLPWEEVFCNESDFAVLNPSNRKGHDTYVSLLLRVTKWGLFICEFILSTSCHLA